MSSPPPNGHGRSASRSPAADLSTEDRARLREAFASSYDLVYRILRRVGLEEAQAEDGAQQAFLVLIRRLCDVEPGKERAFLCSSALLIGRRLRVLAARESSLEIEEADEGFEPEELLDARQKRALLDAVLGQMVEELRVVLVLAEIEGHGKQAIAALLGIPPGTVASRLRRAREDFHARLQRTMKARQPARATLTRWQPVPGLYRPAVPSPLG